MQNPIEIGDITEEERKGREDTKKVIAYFGSYGPLKYLELAQFESSVAMQLMNSIDKKVAEVYVAELQRHYLQQESVAQG